MIRRTVLLAFCALVFCVANSAMAVYELENSYNTSAECGGVGVISEDNFVNSNTASGSIVRWYDGAPGAEVTQWVNPQDASDSFTLAAGTTGGPRGIALDSRGYVYLSAYDAEKTERDILVFNSDLSSTSSRLILDVSSSSDYRVYGIDLDSLGRLYVLYYAPAHGTDRIKVFDSVSTWQSDHQTTPPLCTISFDLVAAAAHEGICVNSDGSVIWTTDRGLRRAHRFVGSPASGYTEDSGFSLDLSDLGGWEGFKGIDISSDESRLFICDDADGAERVLVVDPLTGTELTAYTFSTTTGGCLNPFDLELDDQGNVYVAQYSEAKVEKYAWIGTTPTPTPTPVPNPDTEFRALWVTRWDYVTTGDVDQIITNAADFHFNALLFQCRGNATTFYPSVYEPWAWELTGSDPSTLGTDPGWDPLARAVEKAHERNLQLHAYTNIFPAWKETVPPPVSVNQLWNTHREWFMCDINGNVMWPQGWWDYWYTFIDPCIPAVQDYLNNVFVELMGNYDIDGVHYDYNRYPSEVGDWSYNPISVARFQAQYGGTPAELPADWAQWKRDGVTGFVERTCTSATQVRASIITSAAVNNSYSSGYNSYFQDSRGWLQRGIIDCTMPMIYTSNMSTFTNAAQQGLQYAYGRYVFPGISADNNNAAGVVQQIQISRDLGAPGVAIFAYSSFFPGHVPNSKAYALLAGPFSNVATVPPFPWKQLSRVSHWAFY
jgi:uncharacterized lipoprotein YddW (UPF0748 family)